MILLFVFSASGCSSSLHPGLCFSFPFHSEFTSSVTSFVTSGKMIPRSPSLIPGLVLFLTLPVNHLLGEDAPLFQSQWLRHWIIIFPSKLALPSSLSGLPPVFLFPVRNFEFIFVLSFFHPNLSQVYYQSPWMYFLFLWYDPIQSFSQLVIDLKQPPHQWYPCQNSFSSIPVWRTLPDSP
jgi:hypothetical protein